MKSEPLSAHSMHWLRPGACRSVTPVVAGALCLLWLMLTATTPTAAAADSPTVVLVCHGTVTASYSPPLTYIAKPTSVSATEDFDYCPSGGITGGFASAGYDATASCTSVRLLDVSSSTYYWNSGETSVVTYTTTAIERLVDGSVLVTEQGTVTSGFGQGRAAFYQMILPQLELTACAGAGVSQLKGPELLTFS